MDPCASNFLNCCWNSLHVCPALIYGPSAFSIQGADITLNAQLYQGTIWNISYNISYFDEVITDITDGGGTE